MHGAMNWQRLFSQVDVSHFAGDDKRFKADGRRSEKWVENQVHAYAISLDRSTHTLESLGDDE